MDADRNDAGDRYHQESSYAHGLDRGKGIGPTGEYKEKLAIIDLTKPDKSGGEPLWTAIQKRRSERDFRNREISLSDLSQLLWATQGVTAERGGFLLRTVPSAGALYPIETYLVVNRVEGLDPGLYHHDVAGASLELLLKDDLSGQIERAALNQPMAGKAAAVFVWTAVAGRSKWKYRERAHRYIYMDGGHIGQNLYLAAGALGLGCCTIGAFYDDLMNQLVGVDGLEEAVVYIGCIGRI